MITAEFEGPISTKSIYPQHADSPSSNFAEVAVFEQSTTARQNQYRDHRVQIQKQLVDDYCRVRIENAANLSETAVVGVNSESKFVYTSELVSDLKPVHVRQQFQIAVMLPQPSNTAACPTSNQLQGRGGKSICWISHMHI
jgi:hypothetical protein